MIIMGNDISGKKSAGGKERRRKTKCEDDGGSVLSFCHFFSLRLMIMFVVYAYLSSYINGEANHDLQRNEEKKHVEKKE